MHLALVQPLYGGRGCPKFAQIFIDGAIQRSRIQNSLQAPLGRWAFCTDAWFTFLGPPSHYISFHMHLALVQPLYRGRDSPEFAQISNDGAVQRCTIHSSLQALEGQWAFYTDAWFTFLGTPSPYLSFHTHLALVQPLYEGGDSPELAWYLARRERLVHTDALPVN